MRLLVLILNIVVSASLLSYPTEMLAASKHKSSHKSHGKGKHHRGRGKTVVRDPGNIWDRIRYGMRIPKPNPPQLFTSIIAHQLRHLIARKPASLDLANLAKLKKPMHF
jgi:hypothetical protein